MTWNMIGVLTATHNGEQKNDHLDIPAQSSWYEKS